MGIYNFFVQEKVLKQMEEGGPFNPITGTFTVYIFPPGTQFEREVKHGDKKLVQVSIESIEEARVAALEKERKQ